MRKDACCTEETKEVRSACHTIDLGRPHTRRSSRSCSLWAAWLGRVPLLLPLLLPAPQPNPAQGAAAASCPVVVAEAALAAAAAAAAPPPQPLLLHTAYQKQPQLQPGSEKLQGSRDALAEMTLSG